MNKACYKGWDFLHRQLESWQLARDNFAALADVQTRHFTIDGVQVVAQHNPTRAISTCANLDKAAIGKRPCFLCAEHKPAEQESIGIFCDEAFSIRINPYPILEGHLTLSSIAHQPQTLAGKTGRQLPGRLLKEVESCFGPGYALFYNGAACGASAPDHFHFQAAPKAQIPMIAQWKELMADATLAETLHDEGFPVCRHCIVDRYMCRLHAFIADEGYAIPPSLTEAFLAGQPVPDGEMECRYNLFAWKEGEQFITVYIPRQKHRPDCYFASGPSQLLVSPGALDMAGILVLPRKEDFDKITEKDIKQIYHETGCHGTVPPLLKD